MFTQKLLCSNVHDFCFFSELTDEKIGDKCSMSEGFRRWRLPSLSTPNINEVNSSRCADVLTQGDHDLESYKTLFLQIPAALLNCDECTSCRRIKEKNLFQCHHFQLDILHEVHICICIKISP